MLNRTQRRASHMQRGAKATPILAGLFTLAAILGAGCGSTVQLPSTWRTPGVTIDSVGRDWKSPFLPIRDTHLFVGMQNDSLYFYMRILAPAEEFRRRIAGPGMTVWFKPADGKMTGIMYPMGPGMRDLEILGADKNDRTLYSPLEVPGISVRAGSSEGSSMYELKIPLQASKERPYAVGAAPGSTFRIEIVTEKELATTREGGGMGEGMYPGEGEGGEGGGYGGGGRRGGFGGGRGGRSAGMRGGSTYDALDFKADIQLAGGPGVVKGN